MISFVSDGFGLGSFLQGLGDVLVRLAKGPKDMNDEKYLHLAFLLEKGIHVCIKLLPRAVRD